MKNKSGFTLIETITVIAITAMAFAVVSWAIISFYRANSFIINQSFAVNSARKGVETMIREVREASYSDTGAYPIISASTTEFIFYSDIDRDNNIEKIRYTLAGTNIERGEVEATGNPLVYDDLNEQTKVLSEYVRNTGTQSIFTYFDSSGNQVMDLSNISGITMVRVNLIINVVEGRAPNEFTLRSTAQIRNLKTNL